MSHLNQYNTVEELFSYFLTLLPDVKPDRIASVIKYAKVDNKLVKVQAIKHKNCTGFAWNFEITLD